MSDDMVVVDRLSRDYVTSAGVVQALRDVSFTLPRGQLVALVGRSGSGKTTLLNCIGGLDNPTSGRVLVNGTDVTALNEVGRTRLRRDELAFVFQTFGLLPMLSAAENVGLPMRLRRMPSVQRKERVAHLLDIVGLSGHAQQRPGELSGGQQQRVAIARALANEPRLLIADEPTGQLDADTGAAIMDLIRTLVRTEGTTAIISTHDPALQSMADVKLRLADGELMTKPPKHRELIDESAGVGAAHEV
ncbi:MAG: ABC transporter ATP-binding protein [Rhodoglobus sp.]